MAKPLEWKLIQYPLGDLQEWDENPVQISEREAKELAKSLKKFNQDLPYVAASPPNGKKGLPLVWRKDQMVLSRADYHFDHENILYGWKPDGAHYFTDDRTQKSVFEYPRPKRSEEHPTMKPVELVAHMVRNSSRIGNIVLEPFSGSGSTLLACANERRKCRAIEISPAYVAVALERFAQAFPNEEIKRLK